MTEKNHSPSDIAEAVYRRVFRTDFTQPGFALINLGPDCGSETQRQLMIDLKNEFDRLEARHRGHELVYQSLTRFDQQVTTKPHRDGGPDESILMLGYDRICPPGPWWNHFCGGAEEFRDNRRCSQTGLRLTNG